MGETANFSLSFVPPCKGGTETGVADRQSPTQKARVRRAESLSPAVCEIFFPRWRWSLFSIPPGSGERITAVPAAVESDGGTESHLAVHLKLLLGQLGDDRALVLLGWLHA
jgi:hypothetical protein